jgi:hypothetical protein
MGPLRLAAAAFGVAALLLLPSAASAASPTVWLCKPGQSPNPCTASLTTTVRPASGPERTERAAPARRAAVDCFYVYPTVSGQPGTNASLRVDPEQTAIAQYQASRFSQHCRVFAPMYRQLTLAGIAVPRGASSAARTRAYGDVRDAWREYLRRHNRGRGVVLLGHSQGTFMLRELIAREIDPKPSVRRRLVSGLLIGGNVEVRKGSDRGGDFDHVPACRSQTQLGCVVAYSMFDKEPANPSRFGRATSGAREVLCTNPAALGGGSGRLDAYSRVSAFPGVLGIAIGASTTQPLTAPTPWVAFPGRSTARCVKRGGASWLQVDPVPGDPRPSFRATIGDDWGLHLGDINIAYGQLTDLVRRQVAAYVRRTG